MKTSSIKYYVTAISGSAFLSGIAIGILIMSTVGHNPSRATLESSSTSVSAATGSIHKLFHGRINVTRSFRGPGGLIGLIISNHHSDRRTIAWSSPNGKAIILGAVFDPNGTNYTLKYMRVLRALHSAETNTPSSVPPAQKSHPPIKTSRIVRKPLTKAEVRLLGSLPTIHIGSGPKKVWVIADPLCPHCMAMYRDFRENGTDHHAVQLLLTGAISGKTGENLSALVDEKKIPVDRAFSGSPGIDGRKADPVDLAQTRLIRALLTQIDPRARTPLSIWKDTHGQFVASTGTPFISLGRK